MRVTKQMLQDENTRLKEKIFIAGIEAAHQKEVNSLLRTFANQHISMQIALEKVNECVAHVLSDMIGYSRERKS